MTEGLRQRALALENARRTSLMEKLEDEPEQDPEYPLIGYVTILDANKYIAQHYIAEDEMRIKWEQLDDESKAALLRKSLQSIELLPFVGQKTDEEQKLQFPRCPSTEIPWQIKAAQVENALSKSNDETDEDTRYYERLWTWGVQSYTLGKLSEKVSAGGWGSGPLGTAQQTGITSAVAVRLLTPFVMGGYRIV